MGFCAVESAAIIPAPRSWPDDAGSRPVQPAGLDVVRHRRRQQVSPGLPGWKEWESLFTLAHFVVASREGTPLDDQLPARLRQALDGRVVEHPEALGEAPAGRVWFLRQSLHPQSASDIRARIAAGRPWRHLLPAAVADHIEARGLYGA